MTTIPFGDLRRQNTGLHDELNAALLRVLESGWYILGSEVAAFEHEFAAFCGVQYCIGVASGAEALYLALAALGIGTNDEVITVSNACTYQTEAILQAGAHPVFVDVYLSTHNLDPARIAAAITPRTRAIMPVHLYGRLADMEAINRIASAYGLAIVEDAAQAHGAWRVDAAGQPQQAGSLGTLACFSFYPTKNLGALGDGGAVVTNNEQLAEQVRRLRQYGWGSKYITAERGGRNSRLDELQAALLRVKLPHVSAWNDARRERAAWYTDLLRDTPLSLPPDEPGHVYHLYVVVAEDKAQRDALREHLKAAGIGSAIHYPVPSHLQPVYSEWLTPQQPTIRPQGAGTLPYTEDLAHRILSLPLYPELTHAEVAQVAAAIHAFFDAQAQVEH
ncbi:MAG: DegT/DnrJ/EryC1/StrS family aminotransferase [Chloroflexaceae bacterium]|nr:DegT/DnrJ/EryC1/StrS family aminotransferase [Chloroflexaceae bacterium]NJO07351.1 DegT/DnrJ/EryC1/StrS family aminotransferase [Chloroflexaceae bacterium]